MTRRRRPRENTAAKMRSTAGIAVPARANAGGGCPRGTLTRHSLSLVSALSQRERERSQQKRNVLFLGIKYRSAIQSPLYKNYRSAPELEGTARSRHAEAAFEWKTNLP